MDRLNFFMGFIVGILGLSLISGVVLQFTQLNNPNNDSKVNLLDYDESINYTRLEEIAEQIVDDVVSPDGLLSIDQPKYQTVKEADSFLSDDDIVFGTFIDGKAFAYPQRILAWHNIVNEVINGQKISISYSPLTGSAIGFHGNIGSTYTSFETSGGLVNSNLVMYDRDSGAFWPQILGQAVTESSSLGFNNSNFLGKKLDKFQVFFVKWKNWMTQFPDSQVLSSDTGYLRNYDSDPYGSYSKTNTYYQNNEVYFPLMHADSRLPVKQVVYGIEVEKNHFAIPKNILKEAKVINTVIGNQSIILFYDELLDTARVYSREYNGEILNFTLISGVFFDNHGNIWDTDGVNEATNKQLENVVFFDVMWFAWVAFFPETTLFEFG